MKTMDTGHSRRGFLKTGAFAAAAIGGLDRARAADGDASSKQLAALPTRKASIGRREAKIGQIIAELISSDDGRVWPLWLLVAAHCGASQWEGIRMSESDSPRVGKLGLGTVKAACKLVGGDKPLHPSSYYRGVKLGYYEPPQRVGPNISRVNLDNLAVRLQSRFDRPK